MHKNSINNLNINDIGLFCCGPVPEIIGLFNYINENRYKCQSLKLSLYDKNDWDSVYQLNKNYAEKEFKKLNIEIDIKRVKYNFLEKDN